MSLPTKSPFPGMDPFLEVNPCWQEFHDWFIRELARLHSHQARDLGCRIAVERNIYQREPSGELVLVGEPDTLVAPDLSISHWESIPKLQSEIALVGPQAVHEVVLDPDKMEHHKQDYCFRTMPPGCVRFSRRDSGTISNGD